jgi:hypothetical protein
MDARDRIQAMDVACTSASFPMVAKDNLYVCTSVCASLYISSERVYKHTFRIAGSSAKTRAYVSDPGVSMMAMSISSSQNRMEFDRIAP